MNGFSKQSRASEWTLNNRVPVPREIKTDAVPDRFLTFTIAERQALVLAAVMDGKEADWHSIMRLGRSLRLSTRIVIGPQEDADMSDSLTKKALELETKSLESLFIVMEKIAKESLKSSNKGCMENDRLRSSLLDIARMLHSDEKRERVLLLSIGDSEEPEDGNTIASGNNGAAADALLRESYGAYSARPDIYLRKGFGRI